MRRLIPRAREIEEKDPVERGVAVSAKRPGVTLEEIFGLEEDLSLIYDIETV
jgi:hypothetical protein